jgi:hypothetical protein
MNPRRRRIPLFREASVPSAELSRRELLGGAVVGIGALVGLAGCSRQKAFTCADVSGLAVDQILARNTLAYVDISPNTEKTCVGCTQYIEASSEGCGTCKVVKGPIHPNGYCKSFASKG